MLGLDIKCYIGQGNIDIGFIGSASHCTNLRVVSKCIRNEIKKIQTLPSGCYIETQIIRNTTRYYFVKDPIFGDFTHNDYSRVFTVSNFND